MSRLFLLLLLLLAGCEQASPPKAPEPAAPEGVNVALEVAPPAFDEAALRAAAVPALRAASPSTRIDIASIRPGSMGVVCGTVSIDRSAETRPFIVLPSGQALISPAATVAYSDPESDFADEWIVNCATRRELEELDRQSSALDDVLDTPLVPIVPPLANNTIIPEEEDEPAGAQPAPPADVDSFARSIQRPAPEE